MNFDNQSGSDGADDTSSAHESGTRISTAANSIRKSPLETKLIGLVEPVVENIGYLLRDIEVLGSSVVRITIDSAKAGTEIGIDDCSQVHHLLSPMFDVWDPMPNAYSLEFSSPGEKPNLRTWAHFAETLNQNVRLSTHEPLPMPAPAKPRRNWEGKIVELIQPDTMILEDALGRHTLKLGQIRAGTWLREWTPGATKDEDGLDTVPQPKLKHAPHQAQTKKPAKSQTKPAR